MYESAVAEYKYYEAACPNCGTIGKLMPHGKYGRNIVSYKNGEVSDEKVQTQRYKCKSCKYTHAFLADVLIPNSSYSLCFLLSVLLAYFERSLTVAAICAKFRIVKSTLYEWKNRFMDHKKLLLGELLNVKTSALAFIRECLDSEDWPSPLQWFHEIYGFVFLQAKRPMIRLVPP